jgi:hypothetical protein
VSLVKIRSALAALSLVVPVIAVVLGVGAASPAHAATTYTWTGAVSSSWGNAENWTPSDRPPQNGDSVSVGPAARNIASVPDINLATLTITGGEDANVVFSGDSHVFAQTLLWQGGNIDVDLTVGGIGAPPSFITQEPETSRFGGGEVNGKGRTLTVVGDLSFLLDPISGNDGAWIEFMFDAGMRVASTGIVRLDPQTHLKANRCCTNETSTVVVDGTLEVFSATGATGHTATLEQLGLDYAGDIDVAAGNRLELIGGPVRVGGHAINGTVGHAGLAGGGVLDIEETDGATYDEEHPLLPDGTFKFLDESTDEVPAGPQVLTIAEGTTLELGDHAEVSGIGTVRGNGTVALGGADVRGDVTLDPGITGVTLGGTTTRLTRWDDLPGQRGVLRPRGGLRIVPTSTLSVHGGTALTVPDGARVQLQGGATIDADGCCTDRGRVLLDPAGTFAIGGGTADEALVRWVSLSGSGLVTHAGTTELDDVATTFSAGSRISGTGTIEGDLATGSARVSPVGVLTVDGDWSPGSGGTYAATLPASRTATSAPSRLRVTGTARLAGALATRGDTRFATGHQVLALDAGTVSGRFRCAQTPGLLPAYATEVVRLRAVEARVTGCVAPASGAVVRGTFKGRKQGPLGVPAGTTQLLVQVNLGKAAKPIRLTLSAGRGTVVVDAGRRKAVSRLVVLSVRPGARLTATTTRRASVTVTRVGRV